MSDGVIVFEGDYIRDRVDGVISKVIDIQNWNEDGDADLFLENGRVINSTLVQLEDIFLESEVIG
jgi:hypothetical protein